MWKQMLPALRMTLVMTILTGLFYPGVVTAISQTVFPKQANGSLIVQNGKVIGSDLIGQNFTRPEYFQPRPSAAGSDGYDASASSGSNLGPTNQRLMDRVTKSVDQFHKDNPDFKGAVPADLLTTSASGLDPHLSPAAAEAQVQRIAKSRNVEPVAIEQLIAQFTEGRDWGFLGEPRVNVLHLNLALDERYPARK